MSDAVENAETPEIEAPDAPPEGTEEEKAVEVEGETPEEAEKPEPKDPEVLEKELARVRRESANYRTQLREAQEALSKAKSPEDFEAAVSELNDKLAASEAALVREKVLRAVPLPDELAELVQGATEEELLAHAKKLARFAPAETPVDESRLRGGLDASAGAEFDPDAVVKAARARR